MTKDTMRNDLFRELITNLGGSGLGLATTLLSRPREAHCARRLLRGHHGDRHGGSAATAPATLAAVGFVGGLAAGVLLASQQLHRHRRNLFSPRPYERLAALAYLRGQPSVETLRLLHDYLGWEPRPLLRRRGFRVLRELERTLD